MLYPRDILPDIKKVISAKEFIILTGARQVGKTSLLVLLKKYIEKKKETGYYFNLENRTTLNLLNEHPFNLFELLPKSRRKLYVFIDEIQYLDDPTNFLKLLYDEKRAQIKIITTGSSSFYIDKKFKDSLVGRKFLFEIYSLNFDEFLVFNNEADLLTRKRGKLTLYYKKRLLKLWNQYLIYGGYPKVALAEDEDVKKIMLEEIGSSYIRKDIRDAGVKNADKYFSLLKILADQTGALVNSQELSNTLNLVHSTIEDYLYTISKSYQAAFIRPFYKNIRKELTKMPKVYFYDSGLRNFFLNNYNSIDKREDKGACLENIVFKEILKEIKDIDKIKFWRTQDKKEIDFVVGNKALEIKFDAKGEKKEKYRQFIEQYPDIKFSFLRFDDILRKFYGWKI